MNSATVPQVPTQAVADRLALRVGLEATRTRFHTLLDSVSDAEWHRKSPASAWTVAEVLVHVTWALEQLPREVARAGRGQGMFNLPKRLADPLSYWFIRWSARHATRESIRRRYDAAMAAAIRALADVQESEWTHGARFYGGLLYGRRSLPGPRPALGRAYRRVSACDPLKGPPSMASKTFLATTGRGLVRACADANGAWHSETLLADRDVRCLAVDPLDNARVYAGTQGPGVLRSDDGGRTWRAGGLAGRVVKALAASPLRPGLVYAGKITVRITGRTPSSSYPP